MKEMTKRVITAVVMVPILIFVVIILPQADYLAYSLLIMLITALGSVEMHNLLSKDNEKLLFTSYTGALLPLAQYIQFRYFPETELTFYSLMFLIGLTLFLEIFAGAKDDFKGTWERNSKTILNIIYPGLFASFMIRPAFMEHASWFLLLFFLLVFASDTSAFFFGIAFGRGNKGIVKVSPNKSIAGFLGGLLVPSLCGLLAAACFSGVYTFSLFEGFILGLGTAALGIVGDLIESSFKRSAQVKDSGTAIPGRGGVLDSIDSLIFAAPVYVALLTIIIA